MANFLVFVFAWVVVWVGIIVHDIWMNRYTGLRDWWRNEIWIKPRQR